MMLTTARRAASAFTLPFLCATMGLTPATVSAQAEKVLSAEESDPVRLGWMQGFPPLKDKVLSAADGSFFEFPALRWSVVHMRQLLPTVNVPRGLGAPAPLAYDLDAHIAAVTFVPWGSQTPMTWEASLAKNYTDGMLILHRGKSCTNGTSRR